MFSPQPGCTPLCGELCAENDKDYQGSNEADQPERFGAAQSHSKEDERPACLNNKSQCVLSKLNVRLNEWIGWMQQKCGRKSESGQIVIGRDLRAERKWNSTELRVCCYILTFLI